MNPRMIVGATVSTRKRSALPINDRVVDVTRSKMCERITTTVRSGINAVDPRIQPTLSKRAIAKQKEASTAMRSLNRIDVVEPTKVRHRGIGQRTTRLMLSIVPSRPKGDRGNISSKIRILAADETMTVDRRSFRRNNRPIKSGQTSR